MGGKSQQPLVYLYGLGLHFGLSHGPVDEFLEIRAGDRTAWSGSQTASGQIAIDAPSLFGGPLKEGGIQGTADIMMGEATQGANAYLLGQQGPPQPGYRGLLTVCYEGGQIGANNPYPKPWSFRFRRALKGWVNDAPWNPTFAAVTLSSGVIGMNPAHIVYEVLTNPDWGMGYPAAALDNTVFTATALQLYTEGFGICMLWNRQDTIDSFLQKMMDYTAGVLVTSPVTGLFQFKLIRGGYDISTLPVFTQADVLEISDKEDSTLTGNVNEMWIKYFEPISKQTQSVAMQALGSVQAQGVVISDSKDFTGIATADLAARVCQRELAGSTVPLKRMTFKFKRTAYLLTPGDVFVMNFAAVGLSSVVFRVGEIDTGTLLAGAITVTAIEDVFSMPADTYIAVQTTGWIPPSNHPVAPTIYEGFELDFRSLYKLGGSSTALALASPTAYDGALVARPNSLCQNYALATEVGGAAYFAKGTDQFAATGILASGIGAFDLTFTLDTMIDVGNIVAPCAAWIVDGANSEFVNVTAIDPATGICTIARGCVDTAAWPHSASVRVFFVDGGIGSDAIAYTVAEVVHNKPLPNAPLGQLPVTSGVDIPVTLIGRALLPYPPAFPKINGTRYDLAAAPTGPFTLSWIERNRLTQADIMVDQTQGTVTPESGTTYTVVVIDTAGPTVINTFSGIRGTSQVINVGHSAALILELSAQRAGLSSMQTWAIPVTFTNDSVGITDEGGTQIDTETNVDIYSE
jgi:Putative phage tail protein